MLACYLSSVPFFAALGWPRRGLTLLPEVAPFGVSVGTSVRLLASAITPGGVSAAAAAELSLGLFSGRWPESTTFSWLESARGCSGVLACGISSSWASDSLTILRFSMWVSICFPVTMCLN